MSNHKMREAIANIETALNFSADAIENLTDEEISILRAGQDAVIYMQSQQPESEAVGEYDGRFGLFGGQKYLQVKCTGRTPDKGALLYAGPQPSPQVPEGWHIGIEADGTAIIKMPDGGGVCVSSSENEIARIVLRQLAEALLAAPSIKEKPQPNKENQND